VWRAKKQKNKKQNKGKKSLSEFFEVAKVKTELKRRRKKQRGENRRK
jgi:hypothetical protein